VCSSGVAEWYGGLMMRAAGAGCVQSEVRPFTMERELSQVQGALKGLPAAGRYAAAGALVAAAAGLGFTAGGKLGTAGKVAGAVVVSAGAAAGVVAAEKERKGGAPVQLNNALLGREPCSLQRAEVAAIDAQWGVEMSREYAGDLKAMYNHYLTSLMPPAEVPLGCVQASDPTGHARGTSTYVMPGALQAASTGSSKLESARATW
jgi:hypothetical protein